MDFYHLLEDIKKLMDTGLVPVETASKKVAHKAGVKRR